ncbi:aminodeoxychorismate synthase component I [Achromobacter seleniivolatilans]|uniref:Aminodeoxychorismate synthase component I n=1 Tax=Achromobacter seleniivolatilans TaxID=3047478 RepID=A0ABY9LW42_9BURK|nr:aminodeoxychorismate synthase component I [Achromobacter sp. R39]WMD18409.1 aminodeoxychorismate synthase component I [Achromobacter sp. R39]
MECRFEDRLAGRALRFEGFCSRIEARAASEVAPALAAIEAARQQGRWVALLLDYELGEWLLPEATQPAPAGPWAPPRDDGKARLTALVFERKVDEAPWDAPDAGCAPAAISLPAPRMTEADYVRQIDAIRGLIGDGELYQVNFTQPLDLQYQGDAATLYRRIAARNPVAHGAFIQDGARTVLSFSPELFVRREGPRLTTRPMKGTAPRHPDPIEDERLGQELLASEKNRAENLMIVDLLRNDLGRLAQPGSVQVDALFSLERYPTVWTMTSTVSARAEDASLEDVLRALFPCGSITGAPKVAAMRRIRQMETAPRGLYCGSVGWLAPDGDFSLNVAIRTLVLDQSGHGVYSVGGGIVHDSNPAEEWQECHWKARILRA